MAAFDGLALSVRSLSVYFFFSSRRRHTRWTGDWSSDVCSSDLAILVVLGLPFAGVRFSLPDDRVLPPSAAAKQTQQALRDDFAGRAGEPILVVATRDQPDGEIGRASCRERV